MRYSVQTVTIKSKLPKILSGKVGKALKVWRKRTVG